jgi:hypothetical protein
MFTIQPIDPKHYRRQTRRATLIMMAIFIVIGFGFAHSSVTYLGEYSSSPLVLNLLGAFLGLLLTGFIVKRFFAHKPWMKEAIYGWQLKRNLMHVTNVLRQVKEQAQADDAHALKVLRFYHLGLEQMHKLDDNNHALVDLMSEKKATEQQMQGLGLELEQLSFDPAWVDVYKEAQP